ncbi:MAG: L,D-transpeptidase family protein [Pseudomonadales bacterium]
MGSNVRVVSFIVLMSMSWLTPSSVSAAGLNDEIREFFDDYFSGSGAEVQGMPLVTAPLLARFYAHRDYQPAWRDPQLVEQLIELIAGAAADGLDPEDYRLSLLQALAPRPESRLDGQLQRDLDLLYSASLLKLAYHERFGKVNPESLSSTWNFQRELPSGVDPVARLSEAVDSGDLREFQRANINRGPLYQNVRTALARYRGIAAAGGWPTVPAGPTLRTGDRDARVPALRQRLEITGDLPATETQIDDPLRFDASVETAVQAFQTRHNLDMDGAVGPATLAAMNVPVADRIDQLRLTLERARWIVNDADTSVVIVNIAAAEVYVLEQGAVIWKRRAMVGRSYRQTPLFRGVMTYLEINPTWTVPPGILRNDILPQVRKDPGHLARSNMTLLDQAGNVVDPHSVDWSTLKGMPYTFRQEPGPNNALGRIKFMFPNEHFVFLHDTPNRELFERPERTFSSGCIRVEDPFSLAAVLLRDPTNWDEKTVKDAVAAAQTRRVRLAQPWPVYLLYWTAEADEAGMARFFPDVYARDARVLEALNGPVRIDLPDLP